MKENVLNFVMDTIGIIGMFFVADYQPAVKKKKNLHFFSKNAISDILPFQTA